MFKFKFVSLKRSICTAAAISMLLFLFSPLTGQLAQAGSGITIQLPASNVTPTLDGVCNPAEYSDATKVTITVGTNLTFPVYMKHTADNAYFCFGDAAGLPLPASGVAASATVYIDPNNDGVAKINDSADFGVWVPFDSTAPFGATWGTTGYTGPDPGGWQAVKSQPGGAGIAWSAEFSLPRALMGGWNHTVGLALFYHWWQFKTDDYSWPANGIWAAPQLWGNAALPTDSVNINTSAVVPVLDGQCGTEYTDASTVTFTGASGPITAYLKHTATDQYVCLTSLAVPAVAQQDLPNAAVYLNRAGTAGEKPGPDDLLFTITYNGAAQASSGDGAGFAGSDPGGWAAAEFHNSASWNAEFRISSATIGNWYARPLNLAVAEQNVTTPGDSTGWPMNTLSLVPDTWGVANLVALGSQIYLPVVTQ